MVPSSLVAAGTLVGFGAGTLLGDLWCQCSTWARWQATPGALATVLVITTLATVAASFFFYSRGTARALQARIANPRHKLAKVYWAQVEGLPTAEAITLPIT